MLDAICRDEGLKRGDLVLGGFSQGAMLATDVALHLEEPPAALAAFSGTMLCEERWSELARKRTVFPVLQSHGRQDPLLPFSAAERLFALLDEGGEARFVPFDGPHTIPGEALEAFLELLESLLAQR
ncbi:MAG: hypothetical protein R3E12_05285 [Candidatus Eisenbacteria bacterium]